MGLNSRDFDFKKCLVCGKTNCVCNIIKTEERFDYIKKEEMKFYEKIDHICLNCGKTNCICNISKMERECPYCLRIGCRGKCLIRENKFYEKIEHICPKCGKLKCKCDIIEIKNKCPKCLKYGCNGECSDILRYDLKSREILGLLSLLELINAGIMSGEEIIGLGNHILSIGESKEDLLSFIKENEEYFDLKNMIISDDSYNKIIDIFVTLDKVIKKLELKRLEILGLISTLILTLQKTQNSSNQDNIKGVLIHIGKEIILLGNEIRDLEINKKELEIKSGKY